MSVEFKLESPPHAWIDDVPRRDPIVDMGRAEWVADQIMDGSPIVSGEGTPVRWADIPPRAHFHAPDVLHEALGDAMAGVGMLVFAMVDHEALRELDVDGYRRRLAEDSGCGGIPEYKWACENAWLLTPREIGAALTTFEAAPDPDGVVERLLGPEWLAAWRRWLAFLRLGVSNEGIRVHSGKGERSRWP